MLSTFSMPAMTLFHAAATVPLWGGGKDDPRGLHRQDLMEPQEQPVLSACSRLEAEDAGFEISVENGSPSCLEGLADVVHQDYVLIILSHSVDVIL